mmetsp:Transcript_14264/g.32407  ORF Transcript_14264/g.32407 Transcript_14264/m.32407 type:complete len:222 (-) Transcript_14264:978-1643(-)
MPLLCAPPFDFLARLPLEAMLVLRPAASPDMKFRAAMLRAMALVPPLLTPMSILNFSVLIGAPTSASRLLTSFMPFSKRFISKPDSITSERVSTNSVMLISASSSSSGTIMSKTSTGSSPNCCKTAISLSPVLKTSSISLRVSIPFPSLSNDLNSLFNSFMSVRFFLISCALRTFSRSSSDASIALFTTTPVMMFMSITLMTITKPTKNQERRQSFVIKGQ